MAVALDVHLECRFRTHATSLNRGPDFNLIGLELSASCLQMANELDVLRDVCSKLEQAEIDYMLTGSMAMNFYAQPRMTRDIDVILAVDSGHADTLLKLFETEYYVSREALVSSIARKSLFNIIHNETVIKVDLIIKKDSEYRTVEFGRRTRVRIDAFFVWIVSKEDLMISKLLWAQDSHSELQLRDIRNLARTGYDADYLKSWTARLGLAQLFEECIE